MSDSYAYLRLGNPNGHWPELAATVQRQLVPGWAARGAELMGMFSGLFGMQSNELVVLLHNAAQVDLRSLTDPLMDVSVVRATRLRATARPTAFTPLTRTGLYVFRSFRLLPGSVAETVRLSRQAWQTFESDSRYATEPIGLFEELDVPAEGAENMLLLTWYDGFASWEASRKPALEATENFQQRYALTTRTGAIATRLLTGA